MKKKLIAVLLVTLLLTACASKPTQEGTVSITEENLTNCLLIMTDGFADGDADNPTYISCAYSCEYQPDIAATGADVSFDIVFDGGVSAHVHFTGEPLMSDDLPLSSPVPTEESGLSYSFENVTGWIAFGGDAAEPSETP